MCGASNHIMQMYLKKNLPLRVNVFLHFAGERDLCQPKQHVLNPFPNI